MNSISLLNFPNSHEIPSSFQLEEVHQKNVLINGEFIVWQGNSQDVYSPIFLKTDNTLSKIKIGSYPLCTTVEAKLALNAALNAFDNGRGEWPLMSIRQRIEAMENFVEKMIEQRDKVVKLLIWEICKSAKDSEKEFDRTVESIQETIKTLKILNENQGEIIITEGIIAQTKKLPYGVVLCMGPYNYPLNETFATLIPALLMGNTILFKPPRHGTLLFEPLLDAFRECFPKGVINTLYGRGRDITPALMQSGKIDVLAFIGSSKVANGMIKEHPFANRLHSILGLDAKNASIIDKTADLDLAVKECVLGSFSFNGQRCTAMKIIFVEKTIADQFNMKFCKAVSEYKIGMPWEKDVLITPMADPTKPTFVQECIDEALKNGAEIINKQYGGGQITESFISPTIIYPVNEKMGLLYNEEQFAPIIPIVPFDDIDTPINYISQSSTGQQVAIFSTNTHTINLLTNALQCQVGRININSQCQRGPDTLPFTGRKNSAQGTLSITEALNEMAVDSVIAAKDTEINEKIIEDLVNTYKV